MGSLVKEDCIWFGLCRLRADDHRIGQRSFRLFNQWEKAVISRRYGVIINGGVNNGNIFVLSCAFCPRFPSYLISIHSRTHLKASYNNMSQTEERPAP